MSNAVEHECFKCGKASMLSVAYSADYTLTPKEASDE